MSYVVLTIDTANPQIEIYAPSYTTPDILNTITIESSEPVAIYQDIYIIDSKNVRHDYTFLREDENTYIGKVRFNDLPFGVHTMYARLKDDVDNYSNIAMKTFEVRESLFKGNIIINHKTFNRASVSNKKMVNVNTDSRNIINVNINDKKTINVNVDDKKMIDVKTKDYNKGEVNGNK